jgi:hypothetical protein
LGADALLIFCHVRISFRPFNRLATD